MLSEWPTNLLPFTPTLLEDTEMLLGDIAEAIEGTLTNGSNPKAEIAAIAPIQSAHPSDITFLTNAEYAKHLSGCRAAAIIVGSEIPDLQMAQIVHKNPYWAFAKVSQLFAVKKTHPDPRQDLAFIDASAQIDASAVIYPFAFVGANARVAAGSVIYPGVYLGADSSVGKDSVIHPNCFIGDRCRVGERVLMHAGTVIGADGFGFAPGDGSIAKIPQTGIVVIEDDVELGGVCTVDRAAFGETVIGKGCKLDSKVHVGHNVKIGKNSMFSALSGIAGSTTIGDWVLMGGHSGVSGHLHVPDRVKIGAMTAVVQKTEAGETYLGFPATPAKEWKRSLVYQKRLPKYEARVKELERKLAALEAIVSKQN